MCAVNIKNSFSDFDFLRVMLAASPDMVIITSVDTGMIVEANDLFLETFGYQRNEFIGKTSLEIGLWADPPRRAELVSKLLEKGVARNSELTLKTRDGVSKTMLVSAIVVEINDIKHFFIMARDISERIETETAIQTILKNTSAVFGTDFFSVLVVELSKILQMRYVFAGRVSPDCCDLIHSIAFCDRENILENFQYSIFGTPCEKIKTHSICVYPSEVQKLFPNSKILIKFNASSFAAVPLISSTGDFLGVIAAFDEKPHPETHLLKTLMTVFSARATAELERLKYENAIHASEEKFRMLIEQAVDGIFLGDPAGNFIGVNTKSCEITGYSKEELLKMNMRDLFSPEELERIPLRYDLLKEGRVVFSERALARKDGTAIPVEMNTKMMPDKTYQAFMRDVSTRKKAEKDLREANLFNSEIISGANEGIIVYDANLRYIVWNPYMEKLSGLSAGDVIGKTDEDLFFPHMKTYGVDMMLEKALAGETSSTEDIPYEIPVTGKNGWYCGTYAPHRNSSGNIVGVIAVISEVTERRAAELETIKAKEEAEAANIAKSHFLANMSHELRTPLNGVIGFSNLLATTALDKTQKKFLDMISVSSKNLLELINDVLDFSKIEAGKLRLDLKPFNLKEVISRAVTSISASNRKKDVKIKFSFLSDFNYNLTGDSVRINQILANLLVNALKFTASGVIEVSSSEIEKTRDTVVVRIAVSDTGIGIPRDKIEEIFEMFHQLDESYNRRHGGAGLGLAIVKSLVKLMNGNISVKSAEGSGSIFTFDIPFALTDEPAASAIAKKVLKNNHKNGGVNILLAEDDRVSQLLILTIAEQNGWNIDIAPDGSKALEKYASKRYDIIFMDGQMPDMDGFEATRRIREAEKNNGGEKRTPIIAITAYALKEDREKFIVAGIDDYISKPIDEQKLIAKLNELIKKNGHA